MLHKKILYVYMSGVCHWDTYNNISQYANILSKTLFTSDLKELHRMQNLTLGSAFLHPASFVLLRHQLREQVERNWGRGISWGARDLTISSTPSHSISRHTNLEYKLLTVFLDSNAGTPFVFRDLPIRVLVAIPRHRMFLVSSLSKRGKASGQSLLANMS